MKVTTVKYLKIQGFTLVEMAVVLVIIGLLIGSFLTPLSQQVDQLRIESTKKSLEEIKSALLGFAIINGYLPCPDMDSDGIDNDLAPPCNAEGDLPWADLALNKGRRDEWGQPFRYRVDSAFTVNFPDPPTTTDGLRVQDSAGTALVADETIGNTSRVIAIVFSTGKNTTAESDNDDADTIYTHDDYVEGTFDDILVWLPKSILINRLATAGKWPP